LFAGRTPSFQKSRTQRILRALREWRAKRLKIRMQCRLGEQSAHIGEGERGATADLMCALGRLLQTIGVDPGQRGRHQAEVQMIADGVRGARLRLGTADVLFDFLEAGFDTPSQKPL
jgi:hypothetical protein